LVSTFSADLAGGEFPSDEVERGVELVGGASDQDGEVWLRLLNDPRVSDVPSRLSVELDLDSVRVSLKERSDVFTERLEVFTARINLGLGRS
jgi:hypothetical protein